MRPNLERGFLQARHSGLEWALNPVTGVLVGREIHRHRGAGHVKTEAGVPGTGLQAKARRGLLGLREEGGGLPESLKEPALSAP